MESLPTSYKWLVSEPAPRLLLEALKLYGVKELGGVGNNPDIIAWGAEIGGWIADFYKQDEIPWCGLFIAVCAKRAGYPFTQKALSAKEWVNWGAPVLGNDPMLGDVVIFTRKQGGHVGLYVGEDYEAYHVLGGNQGDEVNVARINKGRFFACKRTPFAVGQPKNIRKVYLTPSGKLSEDES